MKPCSVLPGGGEGPSPSGRAPGSLFSLLPRCTQILLWHLLGFLDYADIAFLKLSSMAHKGWERLSFKLQPSKELIVLAEDWKQPTHQCELFDRLKSSGYQVSPDVRVDKLLLISNQLSPWVNRHFKNQIAMLHKILVPGWKQNPWWLMSCALSQASLPFVLCTFSAESCFANQGALLGILHLCLDTTPRLELKCYVNVCSEEYSPELYGKLPPTALHIACKHAKKKKTKPKSLPKAGKKLCSRAGRAPEAGAWELSWSRLRDPKASSGSAGGTGPEPQPGVRELPPRRLPSPLFQTQSGPTRLFPFWQLLLLCCFACGMWDAGLVHGFLAADWCSLAGIFLRCFAEPRVCSACSDLLSAVAFARKIGREGSCSQGFKNREWTNGSFGYIYV